jgi:hypothetical protein
VALSSSLSVTKVLECAVSPVWSRLSSKLTKYNNMITSNSTIEDVTTWLVEVGFDNVCAKFEGICSLLRQHRGHMACVRNF